MTLRCLFVLPDMSGGGAERVALSLMRALREETDVAVRLLLATPKGDLFESSVREFPDMIVCSPASGTGLLRWMSCVRRAARDSDIVIGGLEHRSIIVSVIAASGLDCHVVGWVHKDIRCYLEGLDSAKRLIYRFLVVPVFNRLSHVVCVSEGVRASVADSFGSLQNSMLSVIDNIVECVHSVADDAANEEVWFDRPLILAAGRLVRQKGFDLLLRSFRSVVDSGFDVNLLIAGEGEERRSLESMIVELELDDRVFLPGYINLSTLYPRCRLFVLSSRYEGLPTVLIEALCQGVPVVSFDCPSGPSEILQDVKYGTLVPSEDEVALAEAICDELQSRPLSIVDIERTRLEIAERYGPSRIADKWAKLLKRVSLLEGVVSGSNCGH